MEIRRRTSGFVNRTGVVRGRCLPQRLDPNLYRFQSKVWLDMQLCCMSSKPEVELRNDDLLNVRQRGGPLQAGRGSYSPSEVSI